MKKKHSPGCNNGANCCQDNCNEHRGPLLPPAVKIFQDDFSAPLAVPPWIHNSRASATVGQLKLKFTGGHPVQDAGLAALQNLACPSFDGYSITARAKRYPGELVNSPNGFGIIDFPVGIMSIQLGPAGELFGEFWHTGDSFTGPFVPGTKKGHYRIKAKGVDIQPPDIPADGDEIEIHISHDAGTWNVEFSLNGTILHSATQTAPDAIQHWICTPTISFRGYGSNAFPVGGTPGEAVAQYYDDLFTQTDCTG